MNRMENVMVVFSSTDIPERLVDQAIRLARKKKAKLVILDVRDREMSEKVGDLTENFGFMGEKMVGILKKEISHGRCEVIYQKLSTVEERAQRNGVPYEIVVEKGPFQDTLHRIAKKKNVKTILVQRRGWLPWEEAFEVIRL